MEYVLNAIIVIVISIFFTRWVFGISRIVAAVESTEDNTKEMVRLMRLQLESQGITHEKPSINETDAAHDLIK